MDNSTSCGRPIRRHAHVCRKCDAAFHCKAELLEHEQEVHSNNLLSHGTGAKRRATTSQPALDDIQSVQVLGSKVPAVNKKQPDGSGSCNMLALAADIPVDHEEIYGAFIVSSNVAHARNAASPDGKLHVRLVNSLNESDIPISSNLRFNESVRITKLSDDGLASESHGSMAICLRDEGSMAQLAEVALAAAEQSKIEMARNNINKMEADNLESRKNYARDVHSPLSLKYQKINPVFGRTSGDCSSLLPLKENDGKGVSKTESDYSEFSSPSNGKNLIMPATTEAAGQFAARNSSIDQVILADKSRSGDELFIADTDDADHVESIAEECTVVTTIRKPSPTDPETDINSSFGHTLSEGRLQGRARKRSMLSTSVHLLKVPMSPRKFVTSGAPKRMVALTVAPAPRMVSVLLCNRNANNEETDPSAAEKDAVTLNESIAGEPESATTMVTENVESLESVADLQNEVSTDQPAAFVAAQKSSDLGPEETSSVSDNANTESTASEVVEASSDQPTITDVEHCIQDVVTEDESLQTVVAVKAEDTSELSNLSETSNFCNFCEKVFDDHETLLMHLSANHICKQCGREFRQASNLRKHVKISHDHLKPHPCVTCGKAFPYASYLAEHMQVHNGGVEVERRFMCGQCDKAFVRVSGLRKHMKEEHLEGPKPYVCQHCDRSYAYRCALDAHMRRHSGLRPFTCPTCGAGFKHLSNVQKHIKVLHPAPCPECDDPTQKCEHAVAARAALRARFSCGKCSRSFDSIVALNVHERVHTGEKPETCDLCGKSFQHRSNLQKHLMKHAGRRPHACSQCPRAFYARHSLLAHMRRHTGDSPYECSTCKKRFCTKNSLQVHMNLHSDVRPYACDTCGRRFAQLGNLQKHMTVHTGERPHECADCERTFADISALRRHRAAIHDRDARYACDVCDKRFLHLSSVRAHRLLHTGVKPFKCDTCSKSFTHRSGWIRHTRLHNRPANGVIKAVIGEDKEVVLKPGEYIVYLTE